MKQALLLALTLILRRITRPIEIMTGTMTALAGGDVCTDPSGPDNQELPAGLRSLLERSYKLYMRVARLDEQVRRNVA